MQPTIEHEVLKAHMAREQLRRAGLLPQKNSDGTLSHPRDGYVINSDRDGSGDAMIAAWLAEGQQNLNPSVRLYATGDRRRLLEMLGQNVLDTLPDKSFTIQTFHLEKSLWALCHVMSLPQIWKRPTVTVPQHAVEWADSVFDDRRLIVIATRSNASVTREWPRGHWSELVDLFRAAGFAVTVCGDAWNDARLVDIRHGWDFVAAAMQRAVAVVCGDSGPMHLAGTMARPTLALLGPTTERIASHMPSVRCMFTEQRLMPCTGCWWHSPQYDSHRCATSCESLAMIQPAAVFTRAIALLTEPVDLSLRLGRSGFFVRCPTFGNRDFGNQDEIVVQDVYENDCYGVQGWPADTRYVVDVGGHIGCFARRVADSRPDAQVISVEANSGNWPALQQNAPTAHVVRAACSYDPGSLVLYDTLHAGGQSTGGSFVGPVGLDYSGWSNAAEYRRSQTPLEIVTLESLLEKFQWPRIDVLKLDCEGSEWAILEHIAISGLEVRMIVGEYHGELRHGQEHGEARFRRLIAERFSSGWSADIIHGGEIGLFRLTRITP